MSTTTLKDVAKEAGLAFQTVSKILNHVEIGVSEVRKEGVFRIAKKLNYQPNYFARSLKVGKTNCIGLMGSLTPMDLRVPYYSHMAASVQDTMIEQNSSYSLIIYGANYAKTHERSIEFIQRGMVDGLLLLILSQDLPRFEEKFLPILQGRRIPFVVMHALSKTLPYNNVGMDSFHLGYLVAQHLASNGFKKIGFFQRLLIVPPQWIEIKNGFMAGVRDAGLGEDAVLLINSERTQSEDMYTGAYNTFKNLKQIPPAIFTINDEIAYAAINAFEDRGLKVPDDVAVIGANDEPLPIHIKPTLTTVHRPVELIAAEALNMLTDILDGKRDKEKIYTKTVKPHLVIRESCGTK